MFCKFFELIFWLNIMYNVYILYVIDMGIENFILFLDKLLIIVFIRICIFVNVEKIR